MLSGKGNFLATGQLTSETADQLMSALPSMRRARQERVRLQRKRQASLLRLQSKAQVWVQHLHFPSSTAAYCSISASDCVELICLRILQIAAADFHQAKIALAEERAKFKQYHAELQVLRRLR